MTPREDQTATDGGGNTTMASQDDSLRVYGHRIIPAVKHHGSVRLWRCLDCETDAEDVEDYLDQPCDNS